MSGGIGGSSGEPGCSGGVGVSAGKAAEVDAFMDRSPISHRRTWLTAQRAGSNVPKLGLRRLRDRWSAGPCRAVLPSRTREASFSGGSISAADYCRSRSRFSTAQCRH
jgi:hypothetical protein